MISLYNIFFRSTNYESIAKIANTRSNYNNLFCAENFSAFPEITFDLHRMNKHYKTPKIIKEKVHRPCK